MSPAENWRVNDDFLPEGIVSGTDCISTFANLYFSQEKGVVARYKMSQFYIMTKPHLIPLKLLIVAIVSFLITCYFTKRNLFAPALAVLSPSVIPFKTP